MGDDEDTPGVVYKTDTKMKQELQQKEELLKQEQDQKKLLEEML